MKRIILLAAISLVLAVQAFAQAPGRVQTTTRLVTMFTNLENQLMDALVANNRAGVERLLTDDFAQWTPDPPGAPTPRDEWLKPNRRDLANFRIQQMSAKDLGDHVAVNFVLTAGTKASFIVDIWQKSGPDWQLAARYLSSADAPAYRGKVHPSGKE